MAISTERPGELFCHIGEDAISLKSVTESKFHLDESLFRFSNGESSFAVNILDVCFKSIIVL